MPFETTTMGITYLRETLSDKGTKTFAVTLTGDRLPLSLTETPPHLLFSVTFYFHGFI